MDCGRGKIKHILMLKKLLFFNHFLIFTFLINLSNKLSMRLRYIVNTVTFAVRVVYRNNKEHAFYPITLI